MGCLLNRARSRHTELKALLRIQAPPYPRKETTWGAIVDKSAAAMLRLPFAGLPV